jgi:hypothetical protein
MNGQKMNFMVGVIIATALAFAPAAALGQAVPDLNGLWDGQRNSSDLVEYVKAAGSSVPFTPAAAQRYKNVDFSKNPNGYCLPPGPSRAITGPSPFEIVQNAKTVAFLFENHGVYRIVYLDGRSHPEDIRDYPAFMGHSIGKWEDDALVVDTIGINDRTWLDSNGLEHSDKLHLIERFQKVGADTIRYSVTYEDPEFFTKPWTMTLNLVRQPKGDRLLEYVCNENEKDNVILEPTFLNKDK